MDFQKTKTDAEATLTEYKTVETSPCVYVYRKTRSVFERLSLSSVALAILVIHTHTHTHTHTYTHTETILGKEPIWVKGFHQDEESIYTQTSANEIIQYKYCCIRNNRLRENLLERREKASVWCACDVTYIYTYTRVGMLNYWWCGGLAVKINKLRRHLQHRCKVEGGETHSRWRKSV